MFSEEPIPFALIQNSHELNQAFERWSRSPYISIDLEFDKNRFRYGFNLCLIQLATPGHIDLIDPLEPELDLNPLFQLLRDPKLPKYAFEFGEDRRLLQQLGCQPNNVEDVSVASKLLGFGQLSLSNLIERILGFTLEGSSQMSNWFQRPLTTKQCAYAADDVRYLADLRNALLPMLETDQPTLFPFYTEENDFLNAQQPELQSQPATPDLKKEQREQLNQVSFHMLKHLYTFREAMAKKYNRPEHKIIPNDVLIEAVQNEQFLLDLPLFKIPLKRLRNTAFKNQLHAELVKARKHAAKCGLREAEPAFPPIDSELLMESRLQRKQVNETVDQVWKPVQQVLKSEFGEQTATYLMSNRIMRLMAEEEFTDIPSCRVELFRRIQNDLQGA